MGVVLSRGHTFGMIIASSLSIFGCLTIVLAFNLFPKLRKKPTYETLNYIAISNILESICNLMGNPIDGSPACWIEGIGSNIFFISSIFWTVILNYIIYCIVAGKPIHITYKMHIICWGLPTLVTLLPLINTTFGAPDGLGWCWIVPTTTSPQWALLFWYTVSYSFWIWLCLFLNIVMFIVIYSYGQSNTVNTKNDINNVIFKLMLYPPVIIICWGITTVQDTINISYDFSGSENYLYMVDVLPCLQGALTAIVFWYTMTDVRKRFIHMLLYRKHLPDKIILNRVIQPRAHGKLNRVAPLQGGSNVLFKIPNYSELTRSTERTERSTTFSHHLSKYYSVRLSFSQKR
mmetsp:Transcript_9043/g.8068  ORF Transcript_9043/g.8068 Transcript_9043/m.8068 type:complete len:347 (+) Transcript_9043:56-1096(+)